MGIDASVVARVVGIDAQFVDTRTNSVLFLPQQIAILGQGNTASVGYSLTPRQIFSALEAGRVYGFGSPIHQSALEVFPLEGGGVGSIPVWVYPMNDDASGAASVASITPSGAAPAAGTYYARIGGRLSAPIVLAQGDSVATINDKIVPAIQAVLEMPMNAADGTTDTDLTSKWEGVSANSILVEMLDSQGKVPTSGLTFTIVQPASGAADPDPSAALALIGSKWITLVINCFVATNSNALNDLQAVGEGRWDKLFRKPFVAVCGSNVSTLGTLTAITDARPTDRINALIPAPGSPAMPMRIAAAAVREIAKEANNNPPTDYGSHALARLPPGIDGVQWDHPQRDTAVKLGLSTTEIKNGLVNLSDVVTMYKPVGETPPAYRYVVDIMKLMNTIFNVDLEFASSKWDGKPLIADDQATVNPNARKPKAAKAAAGRIVDGLALQAILSDPKTTKKNMTCNISAQNPKRLDLGMTVYLSGNTNVFSVDLFFGFFYGTPALAA